MNSVIYALATDAGALQVTISWRAMKESDSPPRWALVKNPRCADDLQMGEIDIHNIQIWSWYSSQCGGVDFNTKESALDRYPLR